MPIGKLINVGEYEVPDGKPIWLVPTPRRVSMMINAGDPYTVPAREEHTYYKQRAITGDIYVAEVNVKVE